MAFSRIDTSGPANLEVARQLDDNTIINGRLITVPLGTRTSLTVTHGLGRPYKGFFCTNGEFGLSENKSNSDKSKTLKLNVSGALLETSWTLVASSTVSGSAVTTVTLNGLDMDTDGDYKITGTWIAPGATSCYVKLQPNGADTNCRGSSNGRTTETTGVKGQGGAIIPLTTPPTSTAHIEFKDVRITTLSDGYRTVYTAEPSVGHYLNTNRYGIAITTVGFWDDTSTNLTSLAFTSSTASYIDVDSTFSVYKASAGAAAASNPDTVDLWVF